MRRKKRKKRSPVDKNKAYWRFRMEWHRQRAELLFKQIEEEDKKFEQEYFEQMKQVFDEKPHLAYDFARMEDLKKLYPRVHKEAVSTVEYLKFQKYRGQQLVQQQIIKDLNE